VVSFISCTPDVVNDNKDIVVTGNASESVHAKKHYLDNISPYKITIEHIYYSEADSPLEEETVAVKAKCVEGLSTYGVSKIRAALLSMTDSLVSVMEDYGASEEEAYWEQQESQLPIVYRRIEVMISNIESIKKTVLDKDVTTDLTTVQKLLAFSKDNDDISGVFYAHHVLSDLSYWGYNYGLNTEEYKTWELTPPMKEQDCYYGVTKTWGLPYPESIQNIINENDLPGIEDIGPEFDLRGQVERGDESIDSFNSGYSDKEKQKIKMALNDMDGILCDYLYEPGDSAPSDSPLDGAKYEELLSLTDELTTMTKDSVISSDLRSVKGFLSLYNNDEGRLEPEADKQFILISCHRIISELFGIVLNNEEPTAYNNPYYGALKLLEPDSMSSKEYEYFSGKEEPPLDDASRIDDFFKNRVSVE
jgi:hypothetical protein